MLLCERKLFSTPIEFNTFELEQNKYELSKTQQCHREEIPNNNKSK
jgi:hypothetical protein